MNLCFQNHFFLLLVISIVFSSLVAPGISTGQDPGKLAANHLLIDKAKNLSLYAMRAKRPTVAHIERWAGTNAKVSIENGDKANWNQLKVSWPDGELIVNSESVVDGELDEHLQNFQGYVFNRLAAQKMDAHVFSIITQVTRTNHLYVMQSEKPMNREIVNFARSFAMSERAIVFETVEVFDDQLRELLGPEKARDDESEIPAFASSADRKQRTMELLAKKELNPTESLPEVVADEAVRLRTAEEVARRFLCVAAVAMKADSKGVFNAKEFLEKHKLIDALSPAEADFVDAPNDSPLNGSMTWRYEAAWALLWAMNRADELGFPEKECDAKKVIEAAMEKADEVLTNKELRSTEEILDQVDLFYRCHWLCTDFRINKRIPIGELKPSVVYERIYALNWLIFYKNAIGWDDVVVDS